MGSHVSFPNLIFQLVLHKDEFHRLTKGKYQDILAELGRLEIDPDSENKNLPNNKFLAEKFGYKQGRMNSILKEIYNDLIQDFYTTPLTIKNYYHTIHISMDPDEFDGTPMERIIKASKNSSLIKLVLPVTPNIGDEIEIPIIQETGNFYRGYVHSVQHKIKGHTHEVFLWVNPFHNYYYKWASLKKDYELMERWRSSERNK